MGLMGKKTKQEHATTGTRPGLTTDPRGQTKSINSSLGICTRKIRVPALGLSIRLICISPYTSLHFQIIGSSAQLVRARSGKRGHPAGPMEVSDYGGSSANLNDLT